QVHVPWEPLNCHPSPLLPVETASPRNPRAYVARERRPLSPLGPCPAPVGDGVGLRPWITTFSSAAPARLACAWRAPCPAAGWPLAWSSRSRWLFSKPPPTTGARSH